MISAYFFATTLRLTLSVGPSSPVGIEKSAARMVNFWIFCAFDVACLLARAIPSSMAANTWIPKKETREKLH